MYVTKHTVISLSNNEFNFTHMNIYDIRSHLKVNVSNDEADCYDKNMFLNSKLKLLLLYERIA